MVLKPGEFVAKLINVIYCLAFMIGILVGLIYLTCNENVPKSDYQLAMRVLLGCFLARLALSVVMAVVGMKFQKKEEMVKWNTLIFLGISLISGWIPRISVFFVPEYIWTPISIALFAIGTVQTIIIGVYEKEHGLKIKYSGTVIGISTVTHVFLLVISIIMAWMFFENSTVTPKIITFQLAFFLICLVSSVQFLMIWRGNFDIKYKNGEDGAEHTNLINSASLECKICLLPYSDTNRIPRILKECGHTVCEECADEFLKKNDNQHLSCPFCKGTTLVQGPAAQMPRNFTILEMLDEQQKVKTSPIIIIA